ncbi:MAG: hypothetical protein JSV88_33835 [Candidatus Aminicenantes bacterium]|nr:MAG: hypothetical protein JSV88_33835 [Candidatus Aminicenantes bacterium]
MKTRVLLFIFVIILCAFGFSRDMARFGYLYLNNGFVDGKQIPPVEWVEEPTMIFEIKDRRQQ